MEGYTSQEDHETLYRIENQLKRRMAIGTQVSEHTILQDFMRQVFSCELAILYFLLKVISYKHDVFVF